MISKRLLSGYIDRPFRTSGIFHNSDPFRWKFIFRPALIALLSAVVVLLACNDASQKPEETHTAPAIIDSSENWALTSFIKADAANPVLGPGNGQFFCPVLKKKISWENKDVFNPAVIIREGKIFLIYRAEDTIGKYAGTSRIGLAESTDGLHFTRHPEPVLFPDNDDQKKYEWEGGCEDPRVVEDSSGVYYMTYTAYDGKIARMLVASSTDLKKWEKHGPAFAKAFNGRYRDKWSKSGSIVSAYQGGRIVATKINGKYWMYWGDVNIWAATSDDLINWEPVLYTNGEKPTIELRRNAGEIAEVKIVFGPRKGFFDSDLVEPGPPAMITPKGIVLIYNSRNIPSIGDSTLPEGTYAAGQVLLDAKNPVKVLQRMNSFFLKPDKPYEMTGQINFVCFAEGLVHYNNKWFLYYGTADSKIAVAVRN